MWKFISNFGLALIFSVGAGIYGYSLGLDGDASKELKDEMRPQISARVEAEVRKRWEDSWESKLRKRTSRLELERNSAKKEAKRLASELAETKDLRSKDLKDLLDAQKARGEFVSDRRDPDRISLYDWKNLDGASKGKVASMYVGRFFRLQHGRKPSSVELQLVASEMRKGLDEMVGERRMQDLDSANCVATARTIWQMSVALSKEKRR